MQRFNDASGKQWEFDVNVGSIERVKAACGVDLTLMFGEGSLLRDLCFNPLKLCNVLWELCGTGGDINAFYAVMKGDALLAGFNALNADVIDFFPNPHHRETCRKMVAKLWEVTEAAEQEAEEKIAAISLTSLKPAIDAQALSESTPVDSRSAV